MWSYSERVLHVLLRLTIISLVLGILVNSFAFMGILVYATVLAGRDVPQGWGGNVAGICMGLFCFTVFLAMCLWVIGVCVDPFGKEHALELKKYDYEFRSGNFPG